MNFRNAPIALKVALAPLVTLVCLLGVAVMGGLAISNLSGSLDRTVEVTLPAVTRATALETRIVSLYGLVNQSMVWTGAAVSEDRVAALDKTVLAELDDVAKLIASERESPLWSPQAKQQLEQVETVYTSFRQAGIDALDMKDSGLDTAAPYIMPMQTKYEEVKVLLAALVKSNGEEALALVASAKSTADLKGNLMAISTGLALLLGAAAAFFGARLIVGPLRIAKSMAEALAQGDLTRRYRGTFARDETGQLVQSLDSVCASLNDMVTSIRESSMEVVSASGEIAQGNADLASRTELRSAGLQRSVSSVGELTLSVNDNATTASGADALAKRALEVASHGQAAMASVVGQVEQLSARSKQIAEIVAVIDSIAFQTNILALNAAVEAARAGEQGRGFAVVASEVRSLAQRSAASAKEIRVMIGSSVSSTAEVAAGVQTAGTTMKEIVDSVQQASEKIGEIAVASRHQATSIAEIEGHFTELDNSTQQDAALVEESAAAAESLLSQARNVSNLVERFNVQAGVGLLSHA